MPFISDDDIKIFLNETNYDIRESHNGRWIDQKCTPDVLWSISDFILNYIENVKEEFTVNDIWRSEYAKATIAETYSKPGTDEASAENEYDKVFSQPINLLCYAGVLEDISTTRRHLYRVVRKEVLEYISKNDNYSLRFLQMYIEKVLKDSNIYHLFENFFDRQDSAMFSFLKKEFIDFYHLYTPVQKDYEPKRIFTKVLNPLAYKFKSLGTEKGRMSKNIIVRSDLMYNRDNFRDVYKDKPKGITRKDWLSMHPEIDIRNGYYEQVMASIKKFFKGFIFENRRNISELTQFGENYDDFVEATQVHHIFPKNEFPEIMHYIENLIALTPNQHFCYAHPDNNTQIVDLEAQKVLLIAKTSKKSQNSYIGTSFSKFHFILFVLAISNTF